MYRTGRLIGGPNCRCDVAPNLARRILEFLFGFISIPFAYNVTFASCFSFARPHRRLYN